MSWNKTFTQPKAQCGARLALLFSTGDDSSSRWSSSPAWFRYSTYGRTQPTLDVSRPVSGFTEGILLCEAAWSYFDTLQKAQLLSTSDTALHYRYGALDQR